MAEFLVRIQIALPGDLPPETREKLTTAESARGRELIEAGILRRIWRLPGQTANISLYDVRDATALHEALTSLPLWPFMKIGVDALAIHPLEAQS
jgi:muconolactone D-isomerase